MLRPVSEDRPQRRHARPLIEEFPVPREARDVSISIDRVASPMEEPNDAPTTPVDPRGEFPIGRRPMIICLPRISPRESLGSERQVR
jgi:hypothetical protein